MSAWKMTVAVLVAVCLHATRTLASEAEHDSRMADAVPHRHAAPIAVKHAEPAKAKKAPAVRRTPARDRTTDLELPQLG